MARNRRPTVILVMAILNMVMGGITLLCGICAAGGNALIATLGTTAPGAGNPVQDMTAFMNKEAPGWQAVEIGRGLILLLFAVVLVSSGIGLLKMQSWARWVSLAYAAASVILTLAYTVYELGFVVPAMEKFQAQQMQLNKGNQPPPGFQAGQRIGSMFGVGMTSGISILYAIALAISVLLPQVQEAFTAQNRRMRYTETREDDEDDEDNDDRDADDRDWDDDRPPRRRRRRPDD